jgi:hypothetical protein
VDIIGCPRVEDDGTKENAVGQHRADFKADRRGYSAKGVQSGTFARYASLKVGKPDPRTVNSSPASGAFRPTVPVRPSQQSGVEYLPVDIPRQRRNLTARCDMTRHDIHAVSAAVTRICYPERPGNPTESARAVHALAAGRAARPLIMKASLASF